MVCATLQMNSAKASLLQPCKRTREAKKTKEDERMYYQNCGSWYAWISVDNFVVTVVWLPSLLFLLSSSSALDICKQTCTHTRTHIECHTRQWTRRNEQDRNKNAINDKMSGKMRGLARNAYEIVCTGLNILIYVCMFMRTTLMYRVERRAIWRE